jgi:hypothetical protein
VNQTRFTQDFAALAALFDDFFKTRNSLQR